MPNTNKKQDIKLPPVGIIIPSHNHGDRVLNAVNSVLEQDYPIKIICVIDDGSNDNTFEKIKRFISENGKLFDQAPPSMIGGTVQQSSVYIFRNENPTGPSAARNKGIEILKENVSIIGMLDADDLYLQGKISKSVAKILEDPENIGIVYTDALIHHENINLDIHEMREPYDRMRLEQECIISNTPIFTKAALEYSGGYDETLRLAEDWDLYLRITERFVAIHIGEPLHIYSVTGENTTNTFDKEAWQQAWMKVQQKLHERKRK